MKIPHTNVEQFITVPCLDVSEIFYGVENAACKTVAHAIVPGILGSKKRHSSHPPIQPVSVSGGSKCTPQH